MNTTAAIIIALLVVLFIVVAYKMGWVAKAKTMMSSKAGFVNAYTGTAVPKPYQGGDYNPYTVLDKRLATIRGARPKDAYNQVPWFRLPGGLDAYHKAGATVKPSQIQSAEQQQWYAESSAMTPAFNPEKAHEGFTSDADSAGGTGINYDDYVTDLVVDPRTRDNHRKWVEEMKPWSGVAMKVDNLDLEPDVNFIGLRRPQAVVQYNPLQLTEVDTSDLSVNSKFNFRG
jgi:hypothetical protein